MLRMKIQGIQVRASLLQCVIKPEYVFGDVVAHW